MHTTEKQVLERILDTVGIVISGLFASSLALFLLANIGAAARILHLLP